MEWYWTVLIAIGSMVIGALIFFWWFFGDWFNK